MSDVRFAVKRYLDEGRILLPVKPGEKATRFPRWSDEEVRPTIEDFGPDDNVAERLDNLVDIDPDTPEAQKACARLLLLTERKHARPSRGVTHYWYEAPGSNPHVFKDVDGSVLIEIRTGRKQYTLIPPSRVPVDKTQPESGYEELIWDPDRAPSKVDPHGLLRAVTFVATVALIVRHWPRGNRHRLLLDLAGFLSRYKIDPKEAVEILSEITLQAEGEVWADCEPAVRDTFEKLADSKTTGAPSLVAALGKEVVERLRDWYGRGTAQQHDGVIEELNQTRFVVRIGKDIVYGLEEQGRVVFQPAHALYEWFANEKVAVGSVVTGPRKGAALYKTKFEIWREHASRRQYRTVVFAPPPLVADERDYNLWTDYTVQPLTPPEGSRTHGSFEHKQWLGHVVRPLCARYLDLIETVICGGNLHYTDYLLDWMALTVQRPGVPAEIAIVLRGDRGAGKGTFARTFGSLFGRHYTQLERTEQLTGKFNAALSAKILIFADEAFFAGDKRSLGSLNRLITEPTLAIERKGLDIIEETNCAHLIMATNHEWAHDAGTHERRYLSLEVSSVHRQDHDYFQAITREMQDGGRAALLTLLLAREVTPEAVRRVPKTTELREQQERSMPDEFRWWFECLRNGSLGDDDPWPAEVNPSDLHERYLRWCDGMKINRRVTCMALTRWSLRGLGLEGRKRAGTGWTRALLPLTECREAFDRRYGTRGDWGEPEGVDREPEPADIPF